MLTEEELQRKRQEYRDAEVQNKIASFSTAEEYRQQTLRVHYTHRKVSTGVSKLGWTLIWGQATFLVFFSALFIISYIPKTKFIVTKIFP